MSAVKVHLYDGETLKASPVVSGGAWSQASISLSAGEHILKARAEDQAGNLSGYSTVKRIKTGSTIKPTCALLDDSGQSASDNVTNDNTPRIRVDLDLNPDKPTGVSYLPTGYGEVVSALKLYKKTGTSTYTLLETKSDPALDVGTTWFIHQIETALDDGTHEFCASWVDAQGNESAKGAVLTITIDTQAPNVPAITNIADGQVFVGTSLTVSGSAS